MASSKLNQINPNAEVSRKDQALMININSARGLQGVLQSNLGPKGTMKMCNPYSFFYHL